MRERTDIKWPNDWAPQRA